MSRRSQSRRRRTYGRRQHEVRERRFAYETTADGNNEEIRQDWLAADSGDDPRDFDSAYRGYAR